MRITDAHLRLAAVAAFTCTSTLSYAQSAPDVPQLSPHARVEQHVGITDLSVDYSSPGVKGRKIWGSVVPYDKTWRTGANASTKLTASNAFTFGDKSLAAGTYALYTIPGKSTWTVVLSTDLAGSAAAGLDPKADVARMAIKPTATSGRERLTFLFADSTDDMTHLDLEWEKVRLSIPIKLDTAGQVMAGINKAVGDAWRPHFTASKWLLDSGGNVDQALLFADQSISIQPNWRNHYLRAQLLAKKGRDSEAVTAAEKAQELGKGDDFYSYMKDDVAKSIDEWKKKRS